MKIHIHSCHAVLEYDQARMFQAMGHEVTGLFDVGSHQRPKVPGVTDIDPPGPVHERATNLETTLEDLNGADVVVMHQTGDYPYRAGMFAKLGVPTVVMAFGQGNALMHAQLADVCVANKQVHIASYSHKDTKGLVDCGAPPQQVHLIRFGKPLGEFGPWIGDWGAIYCSGNSIHRRGDACGWPVLEPIMESLPIILSGIETEQVGGLGEIPYHSQAILFRRCRAFLALGTVPAPYTLAPMEAACHGCPVIAWNNGCGIAGEGFPWHIVSTTQELLWACRIHLDGRQVARSEHTAQHAAQDFRQEQVALKWARLFQEMGL